MSTVVKKSSSVFVRPSEPLTTSDTTIKLSPLDKPNYPFTVLLLYEDPINNAANTIKRALSQALVHYYPFCGRIVPGADGDGSTYIECTEREGAVRFIAASADCSWKQAAAELLERPSSGGGGGGGTSSLLDDLAEYYAGGSYGDTDPLLTVQLTEFACGGFVLGVTCSHATADGVGLAQLLVAVGELARGLSSPSIVPIRWDESVSSVPPPLQPVGDAIKMRLPAVDYSFAKLCEVLPLVVLEFTIPSSFISRVKAEFSGQPCCTVFEVVVAILWRCRTRAIMSSSPDTLSFLTFAANVRKHVGAKIGYYGNCMIDKLVKATSSTVASMDIVDLAKMIKRAKDQVADQLNETKNEEGGSCRNQLLEGFDGRYSMLTVTSWRNIGFEEADFGSGQPARVMRHVPHPGVPPMPVCVLCRNRADDGSVNVVSTCVKEEHADAFLGEIAKLK